MFGLISFGLALRTHGWRIAYLGSDTPLEELEREGADGTQLIVLSAVSRRRIRSFEAPIRTLAKRHRVALGGAGARDEDAKTLGVFVLTDDPVSAAERITSAWPAV